MYVLMEYFKIKDDGCGNTTSKPVRVIEFSEELKDFDKYTYVESLLNALGHANIGRTYKGKHKILINLNHDNCKNTRRLREMIREKNIDDVLSV